MKKISFIRKICLLLTAVTLLGSSMDMTSMRVQAASKAVRLSVNKKTIITGKSFKLSVKKVSGLKNKKVKFKTSDSKIATISASKDATSCTVKGKKAGKVKITATSTSNSKVKATVVVTVKQAVTGVSLNLTKATLGYKKSMQLVATVKPNDAADKSLEWKSSDKKIATVDSKGKVKTKSKEGTVTITATAKDGSGKKASCKLTVKRSVKSVKSIKVSKSKYELNIGDNFKLKAEVTPSNAANKNIFWKSGNTDTATVDQSGKVIAKKAGNVTITAYANDGSGVKASCKLKVIAPSITVSPKNVSIQIGESRQLSATVKDALGTSAKWSTSNKKVATVSTKGLVKGIGLGTAVITATSKSGQTAKCAVSVNKVPVTSVKLDKNVLEFVYGDASQQLNAVVKPANATNQTLNWNSSDPAVATVDQDGNVTPHAIGNTVIVVTADGMIASCSVTVSGIPAESVRIDETHLKVPASAATQTFVLNATILPVNTTDAIVWSSNSQIITVENGIVTIPKEAVPGTNALITLTVGTKTESCTVNVIGSTTGVIVEENSNSLILNKDATKTIIKKGMISLERNQEQKEQMIADVQNLIDGVLFSSNEKFLTEQLFKNIKSKNEQGVAFNVTQIDGNTKRIDMVVGTYTNTVTVVKDTTQPKPILTISDASRSVIIKNITLEPTDGDSANVKFIVDVITNGNLELSGKPFVVSVSVVDNLYHMALHVDGARIASFDETDSQILLSVDTKAANKVFEKLRNSLTVEDLLSDVTVENKYE